MASVILYKNIFDDIINCHLLNTNLLKDTINNFCTVLPTIEDLFITRFCPAIDNNLITLNDYKYYEYEYLSNVNRCVLGFDFVNHDQQINSNLKSTLNKHFLDYLYNKYCKYLNKIVFHIIIYYDQLIKMPEYSKKLSTKVQKQISKLKKNIQQHEPNLDIYSLQTYSSNSKNYTTNRLIGFLNFSLVDFKIDIEFEQFKKLIDEIINNKQGNLFYEKYIEDFELLAKHATNLDISDNTYYYTPLIYAAYTDQLELVDILIKYGAYINLKNIKGKTALMYAAQQGHLDCLSKLIENKADVNIKNTKGKTALMYAAQKGHLDCLLELIENKAHVNARNKFGRTALMYATYYGYKECLIKLIENGAYVDNVDSEGSTALMLAAQNRYADCLLILIKNGANLYATNNRDYNALMYAAYNGCLGCIVILLKNGADNDFLYIDDVSIDKERPLNLAFSMAKMGGHQDTIDFIKMLYEAKYGRSPTI